MNYEMPTAKSPERSVLEGSKIFLHDELDNANAILSEHFIGQEESDSAVALFQKLRAKVS